MAIEAAWELWPGLERYAAAFGALSAGRPWHSGGMGAMWPGPITQAERESYARLHGFARSRTALDRFLFLVAAQDRAWLEHYHERNKADRR